MHPRQARDYVSRQLQPSHARLFDHKGQATYRSQEGRECLLWVPDDEASLYLYTGLLDIGNKVDGQILARALSVNLERTAVFHGAIALNLHSHQLMLRDCHSIHLKMDPADTLQNFLETAHRLQRTLGSMPHSPRASGNQGGARVRENLIVQRLTQNFPQEEYFHAP